MSARDAAASDDAATEAVELVPPLAKRSSAFALRAGADLEFHGLGLRLKDVAFTGCLALHCSIPCFPSSSRSLNSALARRDDAAIWTSYELREFECQAI